MNIKILLKILAAVGVYELMDLSYQLGKGRMLGTMKKHDVTATEMLDAIKSSSAKTSFSIRRNLKIIEFVAKL